MNDPGRTVVPDPSDPRTSLVVSGPIAPPERIGRYRIEKVLGEGGFGRVYLAHDEQLNRPVAIKVPHSRFVAQATDAESYLMEARTVANLDHPNIVPVYDVGSTEQFPCFAVSKYVDGTDLGARLKQSRLPLRDAIEVVATIAEALHYAHKRGLVHRDIKPGNILLDKSGKPFVGDFGLALREQDVGKGPHYAGTPAYMSPEQARGEGHRVDGRSDIFSLGVVFYELLVGRRPFKADSQEKLLEQITSVEAKPPRQIDDAIPKDLERVCLKALSKRASDRYTTQKDMADDLRYFLAHATASQLANTPSGVGGFSSPTLTPGFSPIEPPPVTPTPMTPAGPSSGGRHVKIVPKGLRSFDAHDADFFLELLPGPRDREGLPDSLRFWKTRIEETDPDHTFFVGLIYGPSGCGKSSLVKAGLLPRLSEDVLAVYVEATAEDTESRLLIGLRKCCPALPANPDLKETLAGLRRGQHVPAGKKVLIVLDQFEQWLHAKREQPETELVQALRQCDGSRLQCIVMVRDDFWMATTRFMRELEIRLIEGDNSAAVDLFDLRHAERVLAAFGRAFDRLPEKPADTSKDQKQFLERSVSGLAEEGKVVCVRMALFAEMMKGRPWTQSSLKEVGGTEGVGATFLEETFSSATAPPEHRYYQKAARAVLKALLPESGTDIKGHMRSYAELLQASGYTEHPKEFNELLSILDGEIRLITPTDPEGAETESQQRRSCAEKYFQLTHDYLVPSLREWLTQNQKETRRGRAELLLADRAAVWNARAENRQLPSVWQCVGIWCMTRKRNWTLPQQKMMRKAGRYHAVRGLVVALLLGLIAFGAYEAHGMLEANALRDRLLDANTDEVPTIVREMAPYRPWLNPLLQEALLAAKNNRESRKELHTSLALLPVDSGQVEYLYGRLLDAATDEVRVLRDALAPRKDELLEKLWSVVEQPAQSHEQQRLRAASALATYDPDNPRWAKVQEQVANDLVRTPPVYLAIWIDALRPVGAKLLAPLGVVFRDTNRKDTERSLATDVLADYAADQPRMVADLLMDADTNQFAVLYPKLMNRGEDGLSLLIAEVEQPPPIDADANAKERQAKRKANAAVALLKMGRPEKVWPLLQLSIDPTLRSYLIHRLGPLGADPRAIVKRLDEEPDITIQRALVLSLGEFGETELSADERTETTTRLQGIYRTAADPGLHAAVQWLLRAWRQDQWLKQINEEWANDKEQREQRLLAIKSELMKQKGRPTPQWYVNGHAQTMVVIPCPVEFVMGSPVTEEGRFADELQHKTRIDRTFAIAAAPVTVGEFRRFDESYAFEQRYAPAADCPIVRTKWYQAAAYCNWLSKQEGIDSQQWCYEIDPQGQATKVKENYEVLTGYRLPTEAEMEYATRAGTVTSRFYGESEELLPEYGWYIKNAGDRSWPVGIKKPNDLGLFDVHGNVVCWCQDRYASYSRAQAGEGGTGDTVTFDSMDRRVLRGGSFSNPASLVRSALRNFGVPSDHATNIGFRPARTYP